MGDTTPFITNFCESGNKIEFEGRIFKVVKINLLENIALMKIEGSIGVIILTPRHFIEGKAINRSKGGSQRNIYII